MSLISAHSLRAAHALRSWTKHGPSTLLKTTQARSFCTKPDSLCGTAHNLGTATMRNQHSKNINDSSSPDKATNTHSNTEELVECTTMTTDTTSSTSDTTTTTTSTNSDQQSAEEEAQRRLAEQITEEYEASMSKLERIFEKFPPQPLNPAARRVLDMYTDSYRKNRLLNSMSVRTNPAWSNSAGTSVLSRSKEGSAAKRASEMHAHQSDLDGRPASKYELISRGIYHKTSPASTLLSPLDGLRSSKLGGGGGGGMYHQRSFRRRGPSQMSAELDTDEMIDDIFWNVTLNDFSALPSHNDEIGSNDNSNNDNSDNSESGMINEQSCDPVSLTRSAALSESEDLRKRRMIMMKDGRGTSKDGQSDHRIKSVESLDFEVEPSVMGGDDEPIVGYDDEGNLVREVMVFPCDESSQVLAVECKSDKKWRRHKMKVHKLKKRRRLVRFNANTQARRAEKRRKRAMPV